MPRLTPCRSECEGRGDTASVRDPAGGDDGYPAGEIDDHGDQHEGRDRSGVSARLAALGDQYIRSGGQGRVGRGRVADRLHPQDSVVVCPRDQVGRYSHVERDHPRGDVEGCGERIVVERSTRVVDRERSIRQLAQQAPLGPEFVGGAQGCAEAAQGTGVGDRSREFQLCPRSERGQDDRRVDTQQVAQACPEHVSPPTAAG